MTAGAYHASKLDGGVTFRLIGEVWTKVAYFPEILSLQSTDDWVVFISDEINVGSGDAVQTTSDPQVAQAQLGKLPGISVTPVADAVAIGGIDAAVFDVSSTGTETATLFSIGETSGRYFLDPGASVRLHWVDHAGVPFILLLEAPTPSFEAFLADSQPIIESIAFD